MKIRVTKKDIQEAKKLIKKGRSRSCNCPVAIAVSRARGKITLVAYRADRFYLSVDDLPKKAIRFIENFDNLKPVKPFTFELPI